MRRTAVYRCVHGDGSLKPCEAVQWLRHNAGLVLTILLLAMVTLWSYRPILADLCFQWQSDDDYSAGQLVPLVAVFLLWCARKPLGRETFLPCWFPGLGLLILAEAVRVVGFCLLRPSLERYALVLTVAGLVLLVAGRHVFKGIVWILWFLFLMIPLPSAAHNLISAPLQRVAVSGSVFLLEAAGVSVGRQGNIVVLDGRTSLAVAEACSGLRMLMAFVIVAAFIAYMVRRPRRQKCILLVSSIPVAVVCNVIRIFVTALLVMHVNEDVAQKFFHDFAGLIMMPIAVMLLFGAIWVMDRIVVPEVETISSRPQQAGPQIVVSKHVSRNEAQQPA